MLPIDFREKSSDLGEPQLEKPLFPETERTSFVRLQSVGIFGVEPVPVEIELTYDPVDGHNGKLTIVGLVHHAAREAKDRLPQAIRQSGFRYPQGAFVFNLRPPHDAKDWAGYELAMALEILVVTGQVDRAIGQDTMIIGELSLNGEVRPTTRVLPSALFAKRTGFRKLIIPRDNAQEASMVSIAGGGEPFEIIPVSSLGQLVEYIKNGTIPTVSTENQEQQADGQRLIDFRDIRGLEEPKRVLMVAAAGGHHVLFIGSPGTGKTLLAQALPGILPPPTKQELLEILSIHSIHGAIPPELLKGLRRPFSAPHNLSLAGLVGSWNKPGALSLAHRGVLFLDEIPQLKSDAREALRQPLTDRVIEIARKDGTIKMPAQITLVAAMNPCPCGYHGDPEHACRCSSNEIARYRNRLSGPILDRIDMVQHVPSVSYDSLHGDKTGASSEVIRERILIARERQHRRFTGTAITCNAEIGPDVIDYYCNLSSDCEGTLRVAVASMNLSPRAQHSLMRVSLTLADLDESDGIKSDHLLQAIGWRKRFGEDNTNS